MEMPNRASISSTSGAPPLLNETRRRVSGCSARPPRLVSDQVSRPLARGRQCKALREARPHLGPSREVESQVQGVRPADREKPSRLPAAAPASARAARLGRPSHQSGPLKFSGDTALAQDPAGKAEVVATLHHLLKHLLNKSGKSQIFIEICSGLGRVAQVIRSSSGFPCLCVDIKFGKCMDVCNAHVVNVILGWISSKIVRGIFIAPPCSTWSSARWKPWRSWDHIYGLPDLTSEQRSAVHMGNLTLASCRRIIRSCLYFGVPIAMENPATSQMWQEPVLNRLIHHRLAKHVVFDQCCFGTKWRKRTRVVGWHVGSPLGLRRLCSGSCGLCWTGKPHVILQGRPAGSAVPWTKLAESYPKQLAGVFARWLFSAASSIEHQHYLKVGCDL